MLPSNFCSAPASFQAAAKILPSSFPPNFIFYIKSKFLNRFETRFQATPNCFQAAAKLLPSSSPPNFIFYIKSKFLNRFETLPSNSEQLRATPSGGRPRTPSYSELLRATLSQTLERDLKLAQRRLEPQRRSARDDHRPLRRWQPPAASRQTTSATAPPATRPQRTASGR